MRRAARHGRSAEEEHRRILRAALLARPEKPPDEANVRDDIQDFAVRIHVFRGVAANVGIAVPGLGFRWIEAGTGRVGRFEGGAYEPPLCESGSEMFKDVPAASPFCPWIEELARRQVVAGCGAGSYCPAKPVTRGEMSVFVSKTFALSLYGP